MLMLMSTGMSHAVLVLAGGQTAERLHSMLTSASRGQNTLVLITGSVIQQVGRPRVCHVFGVELVQHAVQGLVVGDLHTSGS